MREEPTGHLLSGDLSLLSATDIANQIMAICSADGLQVKVSQLSLMQPQKVVRVYDVDTEVCSIYPARTYQNDSVMIALPEGKISLPLSLKPLLDQLTQRASPSNSRTLPNSSGQKVRRWLDGLFNG